MSFTRIDNDQLKDLTITDAKISPSAGIQQSKINNLTSDLADRVLKNGDTMLGSLILNNDPTQPLEAATKQYVDTFLPLLGGTLTGFLTLNANPTLPLEAVTKQYVDDNFLPLSGGTLTGFLTLNADPSSNLEAATKQYVDAAVLTGGNSALTTIPGLVEGGVCSILAGDTLMLTVSRGIGVSATNNELIGFPSSALDLSIVGAGGLDTGSLTTDTIYYLYIIFDNAQTTFNVIASLNNTTPVLPVGYDDYISLNFFIRTYTNGSTFILPFNIVSQGDRKQCVFMPNIDFSDSTGISSNVGPSCQVIAINAAFTDVDVSSFIPPGFADTVLISFSCISSVSGDKVSIRAKNQLTNGLTLATNGTNGQPLIQLLPVTLDSTSVFQIKNDPALNLIVHGFII